MATAFSVDFFAGAALFFAGAAFLAAGAVFLGAVAAFLAGAAFLAAGAAAFFGAAGAVFLAEGVAFLVAVVAFFTTGTAFFFEGEGRFLAVAATLADEVLFPARDEAVEAEPDPDTRLTWVPLLAGVIVPSFGPRDVAAIPDDDLVRGAGDDTGQHGRGQYRLRPEPRDVQTGRGAPDTAAPEALWRFRVGAPSSASGGPAGDGSPPASRPGPAWA